jgi:hypothetical protein
MQSTRSGRAYLVIALAWLGLAIALGASGRLAELRPPAPQLVLGGLTAGLLIAGATAPGFRAWLWQMDLRSIVALHLTRFIGIYFLALYARGELPYAFAVPGGWGDILVASLALLLLVKVPHLERRPHVLIGWNLLGLADILLVAGTATRLALTDPASMQALLRLPLSLLPTFLVPLIIASHVLVFGRMRTIGKTAVE